MKKAELVAYMADFADISKRDAELALNGFLAGVESTLQKGGSVQLIGFGTFMVSHRKATTARNPQTGEKINVPARKAVRFKAGKRLNASLN